MNFVYVNLLYDIYVDFINRFFADPLLILQYGENLLSAFDGSIGILDNLYGPFMKLKYNATFVDSIELRYYVKQLSLALSALINKQNLIIQCKFPTPTQILFSFNAEITHGGTLCSVHFWYLIYDYEDVFIIKNMGHGIVLGYTNIHKCLDLYIISKQEIGESYSWTIVLNSGRKLLENGDKYCYISSYAHI